jgi:hypothetical protein
MARKKPTEAEIESKQSLRDRGITRIFNRSMPSDGNMYKRKPKKKAKAKAKPKAKKAPVRIIELKKKTPRIIKKKSAPKQRSGEMVYSKKGKVIVPKGFGTKRLAPNRNEFLNPKKSKH